MAPVEPTDEPKKTRVRRKAESGNGKSSASKAKSTKAQPTKAKPAAKKAAKKATKKATKKKTPAKKASAKKVTKKAPAEKAAKKTKSATKSNGRRASTSKVDSDDEVLPDGALFLADAADAVSPDSRAGSFSEDSYEDTDYERDDAAASEESESVSPADFEPSEGEAERNHAGPDAGPDAGRDAGPEKPKSPVCAFASQLSDRAIQRITGGNSFLRGRIYARRNSVEGLTAAGTSASAFITVRNQPDPYRMSFELDDEAKILSSCTCPGFRGPTGHCKHVAALLVALRDRERPPRPKQEPKRKQKEATPPIHTPQTVSAGGKRRRNRRRRRGGGAAEPSKIEVLSTRDLVGTRTEDRGALEAWLPTDALPKPHVFEYRITVRPSSLLVIPVLEGSRSAVPIVDALAGFNMVASTEREVLRVLARNVVRGKPATAELRGEDAAELLAHLRTRRALLEPASMELRFADEPIKPMLDLELVEKDGARAGDHAVRIRIRFEGPGGRKFSLSSGAWFEGTPGFYVDTTEGVARPISDLVTPAWLSRLLRSPSLVEDIQKLPSLLTDSVPRVAAAIGANLPDLSSIADLVDANPAFVLKADGDIVSAKVRMQVSYAGEQFDVPAAGFPSPLAFLPPQKEGGQPRVVRRDIGAEMSAIQLLMNLGLTVHEDEEHMVGEGDTAVSFWTDGIASLPAEWQRFIPNDLVAVTVRNETVSPQMRVSSGVDWLSLDMTFDAGGVAVDPEELRICLEKNRRLVKLEDGTYAPIAQEEVEEVMLRMAEIYATSGEKQKLPLSQAGRVQDLLSLVNRSNVTPKAKGLFDKLADVDGVEMVKKPKGLKAKLRDYQKLGFSWLVFIHNLGSGGILADDMGLGKTLQAIALLAWTKAESKKHKPSLVVAPTSVVRNWQREIEKFAPHMTTLVWHGSNRFNDEAEVQKADLVITSYALLRRDEEFLSGVGFRYAILDEAQHIKNPMSATARAAKRIDTERRLALTGTPIENRLSEFWSIIDFVSPGLLGDLKTFEEKVSRPIDRGDEETARKLRSTIKPFVLRRTKEQVAPELPPKIIQDMIVPMEEEQTKLYAQIVGEIRKSVLSEVEKKGVGKAHIQILAALTRLRQVACDPRLMKLEERQWCDDDSGKLAALREIVFEAVSGGHRVLIFSQFVQMLQIIKKALDNDGVTYEYLDGSTKDRLERVDHFNEDDSISCFLISLKAGGTGLNLTGADTVIHFDPWWNPAVEDQATDRAHRIGQDRVVSVYRLIARNTVEEKIMELSAKKRSLVANVLSSEGSPLKGLTRSDLDDLFS